MLAGSAFGQLTLDDQNVQNAFAQLRSESMIMLSLDGTDQIGSHTNVLYSNAFFQWDPLATNPVAKAEINDYLNGAHTHRIVADGTNLWGYDFRQNTYTSYRYGPYAGALPPGYRSTMFQEFTASTQGPAVFLARLLREVYSGSYAQFTAWLPMSSSTVVSKAGKVTSMVDPIDQNRTYTGDDLNYYVVYTYATRPLRSCAFHLSRTDLSSPWRLSEIYYADAINLNASNPRVVDWRITVSTGILPLSTNFVFIPPTTAKAIPNVRNHG